jgi:hypothetical protein
MLRSNPSIYEPWRTQPNHIQRSRMGIKDHACATTVYGKQIICSDGSCVLTAAGFALSLRWDFGLSGWCENELRPRLLGENKYIFFLRQGLPSVEITVTHHFTQNKCIFVCEKFTGLQGRGRALCFWFPTKIPVEVSSSSWDHTGPWRSDWVPRALPSAGSRLVAYHRSSIL